MANYKTLVNFSHENPGLINIADYFNDTDSSIRFYYASLTASKFFAYTLTEAAQELDERASELDATCAFMLLADLEATFRIDYLQRCYKKKKDALSKSFRKIYRDKSATVSLEQDILSTWKVHYPTHKNLIGSINGAFNYRHWIAHGRYWTPSLGQNYDFTTVYQLCDTAMKTFPFIKA